MSDVDRLLSEYISEHRAGGEADPVGYLEQLDGTDRDELSTLLDAYLQRTPGREWDPEAFQGSAAERLTESLNKSLAGQAGLWPVVLPRLRERAKVKRAELVQKLAQALGVTAGTEKVAGYYHEMEQGSLESAGVSDRVLDALGKIVGASVESLRRAGENLGEGKGLEGHADVAFTRMQHPAAEYSDADAPAGPAPARSPGAQEEWDEVDELFRGGS